MRTMGGFENYLYPPRVDEKGNDLGVGDGDWDTTSQAIRVAIIAEPVSCAAP